MTKKIKYAKVDFMPILIEVHKQFASVMYRRLVTKVGNLMASLKKRAEASGTEFNVTSTELRELIYKNYGKKCKYCGEILKINKTNPMTCDHIIPLSKGGNSTINNLQITCARCNRRKGSLSEENFLTILTWVNKQNDEIRRYLLKQMANGDMHRGKYHA